MEYSSEPKRAKRAKINLFTRIRVWKNKLELHRSATWDIIKIQNISSTGLLFYFHKKIFLNTIIELKIIVPCAEEVHCRAKIVRIEENPQSTKLLNQIFVYRIAAQFIDIDCSKKLMIEKFANDFVNV